MIFTHWISGEREFLTDALFLAPSGTGDVNKRGIQTSKDSSDEHVEAKSDVNSNQDECKKLK